jgi:hypothetical protein
VDRRAGRHTGGASLLTEMRTTRDLPSTPLPSNPVIGPSASVWHLLTRAGISFSVQAQEVPQQRNASATWTLRTKAKGKPTKIPMRRRAPNRSSTGKQHFISVSVCLWSLFGESDPTIFQAAELASPQATLTSSNQAALQTRKGKNMTYRQLTG